MEKRKLGQGLEVSALSLGAMGYGKSRDIPDRPEMIALLRKAVDLGMDFFDTAEVYSPWTNEVMVREAFCGVRDKVKIATKFGWDIDQRSSKARFASSACRRPARNPFAARMPSSPSRRFKANTHSRRASPRRRSFRRSKNLASGMVPFSPLGKGFLTGTIDAGTKFSDTDMRRTIPRFASEARDANQRLVALLRNVGDRHRATPAQVALAWLLAQNPWIVALFGTRKLERFEENIGALSVELTGDDIRQLNGSKATMPVQGARYPDEHMLRVGL